MRLHVQLGILLHHCQSIYVHRPVRLIISLSACMFACSLVCLPFCLSSDLSVCPFVSACWLVCPLSTLSFHRSVRLADSLYTCMSAWWPVCLTTCKSIIPPICLSARLCVCLSIRLNVSSWPIFFHQKFWSISSFNFKMWLPLRWSFI